MLMSFAVIGLVSHLSRGLDESIYAEKEFRARLLLQSARTLAAHPDIEWGDPLLRQQVSSISSYDVFITTEGTRLAINQLATSVQRKFAQRLFEKWGMDSRQAETLTESIADWIDPGDRPRAYGAERDYYTRLGRPDLPYNRPLDNIDDVLLIRGSEELDNVRPDWRDFFTLYGDGTIDMHRASSEMLEALFDVTDEEVSRFIRARLGPDGLPDTIDDRTLPPPRRSAPPARRAAGELHRRVRRCSRSITRSSAPNATRAPARWSGGSPSSAAPR